MLYEIMSVHRNSVISILIFTGMYSVVCWFSGDFFHNLSPDRKCYSHSAFIWLLERKLFYLDPHRVQQCLDFSSNVDDMNDSFHCTYPSYMDVSQLDPSIAVVCLLILHRVRKKDLQFSMNNFNKFKHIFTILAHIIPMIRSTKNV